MWAEEAGIPLPALNDQALAAFQVHLYAHDSLKSPEAYAIQLARSARDLIAFLAATGDIPPPVPLEPTSAAPALLVTFNGWMRTHRGTTETTLRNYRLPLLALVQALGEQPKGYTPQGLRTFLLDRAHRHGIAQAKNDVTAVRMFVRYLIAEGRCANLAKTSLPSVGTEDDRLCPGPRRGFDKSYAPRHAMLYYIL